MQTIIQIIVDPKTGNREALAVWERKTSVFMGTPSVDWNLVYSGPINGSLMTETVPISQQVNGYGTG